MPRGAQPRPDSGLSITIEDAAFPFVRVSSALPSHERAGYQSILGGHIALLEEVILKANVRAMQQGASPGIKGAVDAWRFSSRVPPNEAEQLKTALQALIDKGDTAPLRSLNDAKDAWRQGPQAWEPIHQ